MSQVQYYASHLSPHILERPLSGFLICIDVPICRSGFQEYSGAELRADKDYDPAWGLDPDKTYKLFRPRSEVTSAMTVASFQDAPVADEHPPEYLAPKSLITCENAKEFSRGHLSRVRVGPDLDDGEACLIADVHVEDEGLINKICDQDVRDVSCGYTYKLKRLSDGTLAMTEIKGNHLAIVKKGRAGHEVAIKDAAPARIEVSKEKQKMTLKERIRAAGWKSFMTTDPDAAATAVAAMDAEIENKGKEATPEDEAAKKKAAADKAAKDAEEKEKTDKAAKDAELEKGPHYKAAHDCVDRLFDAHAADNRMGKDAFGNDADIPALIKELTSYFNEEAKEPEHQGEDAKPEPELETLKDAEAETEEEKKAREEKEANDKAAKDAEEEESKKEELAESDGVGVIEPEKLDDTGKKAIAATMDAARSLVTMLKPTVARIVHTPKEKRSAADTAMVDKYNAAVKAINAGKAAIDSNPYAVFVKVSDPALAAKDGKPELKSPTEFFAGVTYAEGLQKWNEYLQSVKEAK